MVQVGIIGWYQLNQKHITAQYCINKNKPKLHCNGRCYLMKQLKKTEQNEQKNTSNSKYENISAIAYLVPEKIYFNTAFAIETVHHFAHYQHIISLKGKRDIFHPPPVLA